MSIGIEAIDAIGIDKAFPGKDGYGDFTQCWTCSNDSRILIVDADQGCCFSSNINGDRDCGFLLVNDTNQTIILLSIDKQLIKNHYGGIADCAIFNTAWFLFVEFKSNALGNSAEAIVSSFDKAVSQLKETIRVFSKRLPLLKQLSTVCYIITSHTFPRATATRQSYIYNFWQETGFELSFNTRHVFL